MLGLGRLPIITFYSFTSTSSSRQVNPLRSSNIRTFMTNKNNLFFDMKSFTSQKEAQDHVVQESLEDNSSSTHCGHLACQHDSSLKSLATAKIVSCAAYNVASSSKKKKKKGKNKKVPDEECVDGTRTGSKEYSPMAYAITLTDSVFFPAGGGQPADHGKLHIRYSSLGKEIELYVEDAQNIKEVCVLSCRMLKSDPLSLPDGIMNSLGESEIEITQVIDWDRRFDLMTQHSAQHLVSAVALGDFDIGTHTFSLGEKTSYSYIDLTIDESWDKDHASVVVTQIEQKANNLIRDDLSMIPTWLEVDDPLFQSKVRSRLLPSGIKGPIRLVQIANGDVDMNTCCGTHVKSIGQLQMIKFFKLERVKPTIFRVHFAAAKRLVDVMNGMYDNQAKLNNMLSCREEEQVQRVTQLLDDKRKNASDTKYVLEKLCACQSRELAAKVENNLAIMDVGDVDMGYLTMLSASVLDLVSNDDIVILLVCGIDGSEEGSFLLVGNKEKVEMSGKKVAELLNGRGGGRNGKFQGKASKIRSALPDVQAFLQSL